MSRSFIGIPTMTWQGTPSPLPVNYADRKPTVVPIFIDWSKYGVSSTVPKMGINVNNLQGIYPTGQSLKKIAAVIIDNTASNVPIYVWFPDTGFTAVAAPNQQIQMNVLTNAWQAVIYGEGFVTGNLPFTTVYFLDTPISNFSDIELENTLGYMKASPTVTRGGTIFNSNIGVPALGDQLDFAQLPMSAAGSAAIWNTPQAGNILIVSNIFVIGRVNATAAAGIMTANIQDAGNNVSIPIIMNTANVNTERNCLQLYGMNLELDASLSWIIKVTAGNTGPAGSAFDFWSAYTMTPIV